MKISGLLIDLDGVIYNDSQPIPGAVDTIRWLQRRRIPFRFITNTTMKSRNTLCKKLSEMGIQVEPEVIFSAAFAAGQYVRQFKKNRSFLLLTQDAKEEFYGVEQTEENADFVVIGDLGDLFDIKILNKAFNCLMQGAKLIALQKNRFWLSDGGYRIDAGAFVTLLEYAANTESVLIGKPAEKFFELAVRSLNIPPDAVMMIGDDV